MGTQLVEASDNRRWMEGLQKVAIPGFESEKNQECESIDLHSPLFVTSHHGSTSRPFLRFSMMESNGNLRFDSRSIQC